MEKAANSRYGRVVVLFWASVWAFDLLIVLYLNTWYGTG